MNEYLFEVWVSKNREPFEWFKELVVVANNGSRAQDYMEAWQRKIQEEVDEVEDEKRSGNVRKVSCRHLRRL